MTVDTAVEIQTNLGDKNAMCAMSNAVEMSLTVVELSWGTSAALAKIVRMQPDAHMNKCHNAYEYKLLWYKILIFKKYRPHRCACIIAHWGEIFAVESFMIVRQVASTINCIHGEIMIGTAYKRTSSSFWKSTESPCTVSFLGLQGFPALVLCWLQWISAVHTRGTTSLPRFPFIQ